MRLSCRLLDKDGDACNLELAVEDTGIGMDKEALSRLFTPFCQADTSTTRRYGGTGLGLAICKRFVELMNGSISVESEPGRGSLFLLTLPLGLWSEGNVPAERGTGAPDVPSPDILKGARVLLVEDNSINQLIAREILENRGAVVDVAANGREALLRAAGADYDAVLMDIQMPEMGGIECARRMRRQRNMDATPIIALSACAMEKEQRESLAAGMQDHVTKPVDPERLCATVARWISRYAGNGGSARR